MTSFYGTLATIAVAAFAWGLNSPAANAQSFNCHQTNTANERVICGNKKLSRLDERMSRRYNRLRDKARGGMERLLEVEQRAWLGSRQKCGRNEACTRRHYNRRIAELQAFGERRQYGYRRGRD